MGTYRMHDCCMTPGTMNNNRRPNMDKQVNPNWMVMAAALMLAACGASTGQQEGSGTAPGPDGTPVEGAPTAAKERVLPEACLGIYQGTIPKYTMKNKFNDDVVINGQRVTVPTSEVKFLVEKANDISMQYDNAEMGRRLIYDGKYEVVKDSAGLFVVTCSLSDGRNVIDIQRRLAFDTALAVVHDAGGTLGEPGFTARKLE